jgi:glutamate dehydrogenase/leucine dehydrogenase
MEDAFLFADQLGPSRLLHIWRPQLGLAAIDIACQAARLPLAGARVVVQGFGAVGRHAACVLAERGAVLVGASDSRGTIANKNGRDVMALIALKARPLARQSPARAQARRAGRVRPARFHRQ